MEVHDNNIYIKSEVQNNSYVQMIPVKFKWASPTAVRGLLSPAPFALLKDNEP